ncbi:HNH endonuclease [Mycobacterium phage Target]|uniref:HNH endonuclease n=1 Tax=Mycobacterium phage TheloniousMonk TaxID=1701845 RepID=UPI0006BC3136|nr:HNH endonuclease [Mycobacterium phage TheloniousMonk]ALA06154.1 HNH endonuclease [Mycobacterium phage TheloniousMonk]AXH68032.1 HNH endonuclease [Mycobacterium phage Target]
MTCDWRPVPEELSDRYEVSEYGEVRSLLSGKILKTFRTPPMGYHAVVLKKDGVKYRKRIHVLVLETFVGPRPEGMVACHSDGNLDNNHVSNLRWDSQSANMQDVIRHGKNRNANKTHCKRGHEFNDENTYVKPSDGGRQCRPCMRLLRSAA